MTIRYLFFVFVILCSNSMISLCMATPIVVDYSVTQKTPLTPSSTLKRTLSDSSLSQQATNRLIIQQKNDIASPVSISINVKEFQPNGDFQPSDAPLPNKGPLQEKAPLNHFDFNFNDFHQTNPLAENPTSQQANQENQNNASLNLKNILKDTVKDNEILMELAEETVEVYRSFRGSSVASGFQTRSPTVSFGNEPFGNESYGSSRNFLDAPPLIAAQQQAPTARRSWGEETFFDKLIQFCLSWKGLLTLCGFLMFNSILFKLV